MPSPASSPARAWQVHTDVPSSSGQSLWESAQGRGAPGHFRTRSQGPARDQGPVLQLGPRRGDPGLRPPVRHPWCGPGEPSGSTPAMCSRKGPRRQGQALLTGSGSGAAPRREAASPSLRDPQKREQQGWRGCGWSPPAGTRAERVSSGLIRCPALAGGLPSVFSVTIQVLSCLLCWGYRYSSAAGSLLEVPLVTSR